MKYAWLIGALFCAWSVRAQYDPDTAEVQTILREIITPMKKGDKTAVLNRMIFPFNVYGKKEYTRSQMTAEFSSLFTPEMVDCFGEYANFQIMLPDDKDNLMIVCLEIPEGYGAAVAVLERIDGKWMLTALDLQPIVEEVGY
jgi:hypothetical protein